MFCIYVTNNEERPMILPRNARFGNVVELDEEACYRAYVEPSIHEPPKLQPSVPRPLKDDPRKETIQPNGIIIYGNPEKTASLARLTDRYTRIWEDTGEMVDIPEKDWMQVPLVENWDYRQVARKVYPLSQKDREVVNTEFDKMHTQGRIEWTRDPTPFGFPVFVVWRTLPDGVRKARVVVDIRGLNQLTIPDVYPLLLQTDIIAAVRGCQYISTIDCTGFFHQWRVRKADCHKFTVISHRGQEQFNVAIMGFRNSPPYIQRQVDRLLRPHHVFARGYVDDIVIFSKTFKDHLHHLEEIFKLLQDRRITLSPKKSFLGYPSVTLLGQRVDSLGLSTTEEKLAALANLEFPNTLRELETYLGMSGWLRNYVPYYAQLAEPLQKRKTMLLQQGPKKGGARKAFTNGRSIEAPTRAELESFKALQDHFKTPSYLTHQDPSRRLYVDVDASKELGFGAMIYHTKGDPPTKEGIKRQNIQPILFLSKASTTAERNYWPTELEVAGLVWVVKKTRHLIEVAEEPTIVLTDHSCTVSIAKQNTLSSSSTDKLNLRLIRASQYLSQFRLDIQHKPGKEHVVPDALSRLL